MVYPEVVAAKILHLVDTTRHTLRYIANKYFSKMRHLAYMKPIVRVLTLNTLRHYIFIDHIADLAGIELKNKKSIKSWLTRVMIYEVCIAKKFKNSRIKRLLSKSYISRSSYRVLQNIDAIDIRRKLIRLNKLDIAYSIPRHILNYMFRARVPQMEKLLETLLKDPPVWIRVNTRRINREELLKLLNNEGYEVKPDGLFNELIRVIKGSRGSLAHSRLYKLGYFVIQDKASILVGHIVRRLGNTVVDVTMGSGLKLSHIIQLNAMKAIGQDISYQRLLLARNLFFRLRINPKYIIINSDSSKYIPLHIRPEVILIDPPCSSLGRLQLQPEIKLHLTKDSFNKLRRIQYRLLFNIVTKMPRDTIIVYSTCTFTKEENEDLVKTLEDEGYIEVVKHEPFIGMKSPFNPGIQRLYPHLHSTMGFTISVMRIT